MVHRQPATDSTARQAGGVSRVRRYETGCSGLGGSLRTLVPATITAVVLVLLLAAAMGQGYTASPAGRTTGASQVTVRPADTVELEQAEGAPTSRASSGARDYAPAVDRPQGTGREQALGARSSGADTSGGDGSACPTIPARLCR